MRSRRDPLRGARSRSVQSCRTHVIQEFLMSDIAILESALIKLNDTLIQSLIPNPYE